MHEGFPYGSIEVISGGMFCGKSEELIRRVKRASIARLKVQVFKHSIDNRYNDILVTSHSGFTYEAHAVVNIEQIRKLLKPDTQVVGIDEAQFFSDSLPALCRELADNGIRVIVAGLDQDFMGRPFGPIPVLLAIAEHVDKLTAICMKCGRPATRSQRLIDGKPAPSDSPVIVVGASESYEARCRNCHEIDDRKLGLVEQELQ
ncbi:MAG: thymidine kinase [Candidatus Eremiobacteraeota bacterium]|nr:thymidine kinase [Candidatus Eremiobacteraeota bacterium]